jgi:hypothetical protein
VAQESRRLKTSKRFKTLKTPQDASRTWAFKMLKAQDFLKTQRELTPSYFKSESCAFLSWAPGSVVRAWIYPPHARQLNARYIKFSSFLPFFFFIAVFISLLLETVCSKSRRFAIL